MTTAPDNRRSDASAVILAMMILSVALLVGQAAGAEDASLSRQPVSITTDHADAHYRTAISYGDRGRFLEAILELREVVKLNPEHGEAHLYLGRAYAELGQYDKAIDVYHHVLSLRPNDLDAHYDLSWLYALRGELELARTHAQAVKQLHSTMATELFRFLRQAQSEPAR